MGIKVVRVRQTGHTIAFLLTLPYDLDHSHVTPDIFSEHLHLLLVTSVTPTWNALYMLPIFISTNLSFALYNDVRLGKISGIFLYNVLIPDLQQRDVSILSVIHDILSFAQSHWIQVKQPPEASTPRSRTPSTVLLFVFRLSI